MSDAFTEHQVELGLLLYDTALGGTPMQGHQSSWLRDVRVGDVVIECTSWIAPWSDRIGVLLREYDRPLLDEDGKEYGKQHRWVIQTNEREHEWHNARFIRIPTTKHQRDLYTMWASPCVLANCQQCARETWVMDEGRWRQELRK